jgi:hypothetical protein
MTRIDSNRPASATTATHAPLSTSPTATAKGAAATNAPAPERTAASEATMQAFRQLRAAQAEFLKQLVMMFTGQAPAPTAKGAPRKGLSKSKDAPYGSDRLRNEGGKGWGGLARKANIGGAKDIARFHQSMDKLSTSRARVVTDGSTPRRALTLSPAEAERVRAAPTPAAAKAEVLKILGERAGKTLPEKGDRMSRSKREGAEREVLNSVLGTKIKAGPEKNATSALILDGLAESVAHAVRSTGAEVGAAPGAATPGSSYGDDACHPPKAPPAVPPGPVTVDIGDYLDPAKPASELASPLIFDLHGVGLKMKTGEKVFIDIDGDGKGEIITNLDDGVGLLVFDALAGAEVEGAGRDYFGDRTDLTAYGIHSGREDGLWENGFDALRALCEHFELVRGDKQHLDAADLALLEQEIGLRMRIEGLLGKDRTFSELGITRINLGDPRRIQSIKAATEDRFGNKLMKQEGATFLVKGQEREYADIWFNVLARDVEADGRRPEARP